MPGDAAGLWTHTPTDWAGNEGYIKPTAWPTDALNGSPGQTTGTRPGGGVQGPSGTVAITDVFVSAITTTTASVSFNLSAAPTSSRVNYGTTQAMALNAAGTATAGQQTVALSGLTTGTTYFYTVQATNPAGVAVTAILSFRTL
jgi:hypothetical protein